jgi:hypothetical protein
MKNTEGYNTSKTQSKIAVKDFDEEVVKKEFNERVRSL